MFMADRNLIIIINDQGGFYRDKQFAAGIINNTGAGATLNLFQDKICTLNAR